MVFDVWYLSLSKIFPRVIHVIAHIGLHSFLCPTNIPLDHLLVCDYLGCFHCGVITTNAAMNICVGVSVLTCVFNNFEYIARRSSAGSCGYSVLNLLRTCQKL